MIPSPMPVAIKRFYSSSIEYAGTLGRGWVVPSASAAYEPEHGRLETVTLVHDEERRLAVACGYDENGQLVSMTDANEAVVRKIVEYTDFDGGFYRIKYNEAGMPVMLMLPGERTPAFEYDDAGQIVAETDHA